jgi:hypothetical protein
LQQPLAFASGVEAAVAQPEDQQVVVPLVQARVVREQTRVVCEPAYPAAEAEREERQRRFCWLVSKILVRK